MERVIQILGSMLIGLILMTYLWFRNSLKEREELDIQQLRELIIKRTGEKKVSISVRLYDDMLDIECYWHNSDCSYLKSSQSGINFQNFIEEACLFYERKIKS